MNWKIPWLFFGLIIVLSQCQILGPDAKTIRKEVRQLSGGSQSLDDTRAAAIEDYSQAIRLNPDYAAAYFDRGLAYDIVGERALAHLDWLKACEMGYEPACERVEPKE